MNETVIDSDLLAELRDDAEKWRAVMACKRLRVLGFAGICEDSKYAPIEEPYAHIGLELYTTFGDVSEKEQIDARKWFDAYVTKAVKLYREAE